MSELKTLDSNVTVLRLRSWERAERQVRAERLKTWLTWGAVLAFGTAFWWLLLR